MNDVKWYYTTYIIIPSLPYLSKDGCLLSWNVLHQTIQYTKRGVTDGHYPHVYLHHNRMFHTKGDTVLFLNVSL
jgi:hypothetical protein